MLLNSQHSSDASMSSSRGLYHVVFQHGRPVKLLAVSWTAFEDAFKAANDVVGARPCKLTRHSVYPNSAERMNRELALQALCTETLNYMATLHKKSPGAYRQDPTGTIQLASLFVEFDQCISSDGQYAPDAPNHFNITRAREVYQHLVAAAQVLHDIWQPEQRVLYDWVSPNIKKLSAVSLTAQTLHACANVVFAHEEVLHECTCRCPLFHGKVGYGESGALP
jgi:hypothetical protein